MDSAEVSPIIRMVPPRAMPHLRGLEIHPRGMHERRPANDDARRRIRDVAYRSHQAGAIAPWACGYLVPRAQATLRHLPRHSKYHILQHGVGPRVASRLMQSTNVMRIMVKDRPGL